MKLAISDIGEIYGAEISALFQRMGLSAKQLKSDF
jgi:hypothetical protein